ncbi:MAG TPA: hypothetical protein VK907_09735 [Phnomibacter sp.]|nr:hypothetical protein [Phnomibacter sp.]
MATLSKAILLATIAIFGPGIFCFGQKLVENHIEVIEQFSKVKSKSRSLISYAKRNMEGSPALDTVELKYMDLKEASDGAISRYKRIIDNPSLAKKTEATMTESLNEMNEAMASLQTFIRDRANTGMGFQQMSPIALVTSFTGLGGSLIKEINGMQKAKKETAKTELDQYKLDDWVDIK